MQRTKGWRGQWRRQLNIMPISVMWAIGVLAATGLAVPVEARVHSDSGATAGDVGGERVLHKEVVVRAELDRVWWAWTTSEGIARFFAPESNIDLRLDGPYELFMAAAKPDGSGKRGTQGCKVLSFVPREMLSFEWNFPPSIPALRQSDAKTSVVLLFDSMDDGRVRVRFYQLGWQEGEDWDAGYAYFDKAWDSVLDQFKLHYDGPTISAGTLEEHAGDDTRGGTTYDNVNRWQDGHVSVESHEGSRRRQVFELTIPVPVEMVWAALATTEGMRRYLDNEKAQIVLHPGGKYTVWPGANNRVLAYVPQRMLSISGSAPPQFPTVRKGGTWAAYILEPVGNGSTHIRLVAEGWQRGQEWDDAYAYFLKNNPIYLNHVRGQLVEARQTQIRDSALRQEAIISAPVAQVWQALSTSEGLKSWMAPHVDIELCIGGKMRTNYNPNGTIGDPATIENTILSYDPQRMLSIKATKPPAGFPYPDAIKDMWSVIYLESVSDSETRVTVVGLGYGGGDESANLRSFFEQGNAYTLKMLTDRFAEQTPEPGEDHEQVGH